MITHALVTPRLGYFNVSYVELPSKKKPLLVQNATVQMLSGANRLHCVTPILQHLHWLPVIFWAQFSRC